MSGKPPITIKLRIGHISRIDEDKLHSNDGNTWVRWKVFVKTFNNEEFQDNSFIKKVQFRLHADFANNVRSVTTPPFYVTESGYGSFPIPILIFLNGVSKPIDFLYDFHLTTEPDAKYDHSHEFIIRDYNNAFYGTAKKFGAERKIPGEKVLFDGTLPLAPSEHKKRRKTEVERKENIERDSYSPPVAPQLQLAFKTDKRREERRSTEKDSRDRRREEKSSSRAAASPSGASLSSSALVQMPFLQRQSLSPHEDSELAQSSTTSPGSPPILHSPLDLPSLQRRLVACRDEALMLQALQYLIEADPSAHFSLSPPVLSYNIHSLTHSQIVHLYSLLGP